MRCAPGAEEPTAGQEDQGEPGLALPTVRFPGVSAEDAEGTRDDAGDGEGDALDSPGIMQHGSDPAFAPPSRT